MSQINKYKEYVDGDTEVLNWVNTTLNAYFKTNPEDQTEVEHIIDFLKSDRAPKRLGKMSYAQAKASAEKWIKSLEKKGNNIIELDSDVEVVHKFKGGGKLVKLKGEAAYKREGAKMRHCVASYYGKSVDIYSLRDANNEPHCTIEVTKGNDGQINQIKGKGNGSIHPRYIKAVMLSLKKLGKEIRVSEMKNLGYEDLEEVTPGLTKFLEQNFDGVKYLTMQGKKLFYTNSKLVPRSK